MADGGSTKLFVRHLPSQLNASDKTDLLKHFGAKEVVCMERKGKMVSSWPEIPKRDRFIARVNRCVSTAQIIIYDLDCFLNRFQEQSSFFDSAFRNSIYGKTNAIMRSRACETFSRGLIVTPSWLGGQTLDFARTAVTPLQRGGFRMFAIIFIIFTDIIHPTEN